LEGVHTLPLLFTDGPLSSPTRIAGGPGWREGSILKYMRRAMYNM
jgi:hypothetical protein